MSILSSTHIGLYEKLVAWCKNNLLYVNYWIEKSEKNNLYNLFICPIHSNCSTFISVKDLPPCKLYFKGSPKIILENMNDTTVNYLSCRFNFFCESVKISHSVFTEKSIGFITKYKNLIENSYIIIHNDKELARTLLNTEPYSVLFVSNNVNVLYSEEEEEEEEEEISFEEIKYKTKKSEEFYNLINKL